MTEWGFPSSSEVESTCNAGDPGSNPGLERPPGAGNGNPLQYSPLESPMDRGAWWATYSPWGRKQSDRTEQLHFHLFLSDKGLISNICKEVIEQKTDNPI